MLKNNEKVEFCTCPNRIFAWYSWELFFLGTLNKETIFFSEIHLYKDLLAMQLDYVSAETVINIDLIEGTIFFVIDICIYKGWNNLRYIVRKVVKNNF